MIRRILTHISSVIYPATILYSVLFLINFLLYEDGLRIQFLSGIESSPVLQILAWGALYVLILLLVAYLEYQFGLRYVIPWLVDASERRGVRVIDLMIVLVISGYFIFIWRKYNFLSPKLILIGAPIAIAALVSFVRQPKVHIVMPDQTIDEIAEIYEVSPEELERENPAKSLEWGEEWRIP
jgi:hypothetical protein